MTLVRVNEFLGQEAAACFDWFVEVDGLVLGRVEIVSAEIVIRIIDMERSCFAGDIDLLKVKNRKTTRKTSSSCSLGGLLAAFLSLRFSSIASISSLISPFAASSSSVFSSL